MNLIKVQTDINGSFAKVWKLWTNEEHVQNWNFAAAYWHCPSATNNLVEVGAFHYIMGAKLNS
jgi:uncharacterized protein YndB with AHSA1/START domain